jgi:hypothetical protein
MIDRILEALQTIKIYKQYQKELFTFGPTKLPYVFLAKKEDMTRVREGIIKVEKPIITSPYQQDIYEGWEDAAIAINWGSRFLHSPNKYTHEELRAYNIPESLEEATSHYKTKLQNDETGLITGRDDLWDVSLMIYTTIMMAKSVDSVVTELMERGMLREGWDFLQP